MEDRQMKRHKWHYMGRGVANTKDTDIEVEYP